MFKIFTAGLMVFLAYGTTWANSGDLAQLLDGIRKKYGDLPGLTLSYSREVTSKTMTMLGDQVKGDPASGQMFFKPPYFLKLEQETPNPETVLSDEDTLWWYIPGQNRVYKYSAREFGKEIRLLSDIFRGLIRVEERFQVTLLSPNEQKEQLIELRPIPPWQNIDRIILTVTREHHIRFVSVQYQLGSITLFTLNNIIAKEDYEKDFFTFVVPEGAQVVEEAISAQ